MIFGYIMLFNNMIPMIAHILDDDNNYKDLDITNNYIDILISCYRKAVYFLYIL